VGGTTQKLSAGEAAIRWRAAEHGDGVISQVVANDEDLVNVRRVPQVQRNLRLEPQNFPGQVRLLEELWGEGEGEGEGAG